MKEGLDADIQSMTQAEKAMLRYQYVMAHTSIVQGDFADTSDTWANQVKMLSQNFQELGSVLGGVFINAFGPALRAMNNFMGKVISFAKTVADALGAIFGWTIEITSGGGNTLSDEMLDAADAAEDLADGTGSAAGNAAKTAKALTVLPFDELNQMNAQTASGGSGGGGGGGGGASGAAADAAGLNVELKRVETTFDKITSQLNTLDRLGTFFQISMLNGLRSIDWESIYEGARGFGTGLATFLNALISPSLFKEFGKTVAGAMNTAIYAALSFGTELKWDNIGTAIGSGITAWAETFDWVAAGQTWNTFATGILDMILNALKSIQWETVGQGIADYLKQIDFTGLLKTLIEIAGVLFTGLLDALKEIITEAPLEAALITIFAGFKFANLGTTLAGLLVGAVKGAFTGGASGSGAYGGGWLSNLTGGGLGGALSVNVVGFTASALGLLGAYFLGGGAQTYQETMNNNDAETETDLRNNVAASTGTLVAKALNPDAWWWKKTDDSDDRASAYAFNEEQAAARANREYKATVSEQLGDWEYAMFGFNGVAERFAEGVEDLKYSWETGKPFDYSSTNSSGFGGGGGSFNLGPIMNQRGNIGLKIDFENSNAYASVLKNNGSNIVTELANGINSNMWKVRDAISNTSATLTNGIAGASPSATSAASNIMTNVSNALNRNMSPTGASVASTYSSGLNSKVGEALNAGANLRNNVASGANTSLYGIGQTISTTFKQGLQSIYIPTPHVTMTASSASSIIQKIASGITNAFSIAKSAVNWYASGGLATGASVVGIGEAGDEAVLPLTNQRTMSRIAEAINGAGGFSTSEIAKAVERGVVNAMMRNPMSIPDIYVTSVLKADSETLARTVQKGQARINYRNNATAF